MVMDAMSRKLYEVIFDSLDLMCEYNIVELINDEISRLLTFCENHLKDHKLQNQKNFLHIFVYEPATLKKY